MNAPSMSPAMDTVKPKARKTKGAKSVKTDPTKNVKATIVMSRKLDFLLSSIASYRDLDRSELAVSLIEFGIREKHGHLYSILKGLEPEKSSKARADDSGEITDRQDGAPGVSSDEREAA
jgi:hypothetical protein